MCGITLSTASDYQKRCSFIESALKRRGSNVTLRVDLCIQNIDYSIEYNILCLDNLRLKSDFFEFGDYVFLWDGEVSDFSGSKPYLLHLIDDIKGCDGSIEAVIHICSSFRGAFAFILIKKSKKLIFFGRDKCGQHSIVTNLESTYLSSLCLSNIENPVEVPASGIYLASLKSSGGFRIEACYFWSNSHKEFWINHGFNKGINYEVLNCPKPSYDLADPVHTLINLLLGAIARRVGDTSELFIKRSDIHSCPFAQIGILFSGGLDSTVVAALTDRYISNDHPIDLINVAFQHLRQNAPSNKKQTKSNDDTSHQAYATPNDAPDRQTALSSFEDLRRLNPNRHWHLILADVSIEEVKNARHDRIRPLLRPAPETVLNDSLSIALWFAARGRGRFICSQEMAIEPHRREIISDAKICLTGIGADEQLAGYSRHRNIFRRQDAEAVQLELSKEMLRISERNLGRDDRIISDHGRQASHPFLDENVTEFLASLPLEKKADLSLPRGEGEKRLLRDVAASLDLRIVCRLPKRALQFGSRVAKTESLRRVVGADSNLYVE